MKNEPDAPVRLAGRTLGPIRHVCCFFRSREEQNRALMPFFKEGFDRGEKIYHIIDSRTRDSHLSACRTAGIDVDIAQGSGQLEVRNWEDAYLKGGVFDGDRMMAMLEDVVRGSREKHRLTRLMGNMEWSLDEAPRITHIIEYESKVNQLSARYPDPILCVYDLNTHSGSVVMDILRTHPMVIVGVLIHENPLYLPPDQFLQELRQRGAPKEHQA